MLQDDNEALDQRRPAPNATSKVTRATHCHWNICTYACQNNESGYCLAPTNRSRSGLEVGTQMVVHRESLKREGNTSPISVFISHARLSSVMEREWKADMVAKELRVAE